MIYLWTYIDNSQTEHNETQNGMNIIRVNLELGVSLTEDESEYNSQTSETYTDAHEDTMQLEPHTFTKETRIGPHILVVAGDDDGYGGAEDPSQHHHCSVSFHNTWSLHKRITNSQVVKGSKGKQRQQIIYSHNNLVQ